MQEQLTTRQIADALQVSESSVKRWCDRGVIPTIRTVGGHRRIPLAGFMKFLEKTNQQVVLPLSNKQEEASGSSDAVTIESVRQDFVAALAAGNEEECRELLTQHFAQTESIACVADELIAPALSIVGHEWRCGNLEVYQERRGCGICAQIIHELKRLLPTPPSNAPLAMGGAPEGDQYTLSSQLIESLLQQCGWKAMNLGPNIPLASMAAAAAKYTPKLLWLSVSYIPDEASFIAEYEKFHGSLPIGVNVVLGGQALTDRLRPRLKYTGFCDNLQQLSSFATALNTRRQSLNSSSN